MKTWKTIIQIALIVLFFGYAAQVSFSAAVYIKNSASFPAYPYNTSDYMQGGALVGCGPTTGAMIMAYYHHVEGMSSTGGLLTNPGTGVDEGLNTAWTLHGSTYMNTGADGFGSQNNIDPGLENYATSRGYKLKVMIHASTLYNPNSIDPDPSWLNQYGPYGESWFNDGDFWTYSGGVWGIDANKFCDFVGAKLAAGIAIFLTIDTDLNGSGDHWVALVGYDKSTLKYAFYDTYSTTVQWADIYYCQTTPRKYNSISLLRSVTYEGPVSSPLNPPLNVLAMNGYHSTIPLAWQSPATTLLAISTDMKTTESMDDANLVVPTANFPSDGSVLSSLFDANVGNMMSLPTQSSAAAPTGYNVYRSTSSGGSYTKIASNVQRLYYRDQSVTNGTHYYYKVNAVYSSGESNFSNVADATAQANGYIINSGWTSTPPTLNGVISSSEWAAAMKTNITYPGYTGFATLYTMNDATKLYFAVIDDRDHLLEDDDTFGIFFDDDYNRAWPSAPPSGEGLLQLFWDAASSSSLCAYMGVSGTWPTSLWGDEWKTPTGVAQKISLSSGNIHYEGSIDLATSDLKASPGATIGILFYIFNGGISGFDGAWPQETVTKLSAIVTGYGWCYGPFCYGDLKLATGVVTQPDISITPAS
jgi:hypothetical protein